MKDSVSPDGNKLASVYCQLFGHKYVVKRKITEHIKEYECVHCKKQVTTDSSGRLTRLTQKLKEINTALLDMYQRRNRRAARKKTIRKVA